MYRGVPRARQLLRRDVRYLRPERQRSTVRRFRPFNSTTHQESYEVPPTSRMVPSVTICTASHTLSCVVRLLSRSARIAFVMRPLLDMPQARPYNSCIVTVAFRPAATTRLTVSTARMPAVQNSQYHTPSNRKALNLVGSEGIPGRVVPTAFRLLPRSNAQILFARRRQPGCACHI